MRALPISILLLLLSTPALASEPCPECPDVRLSQNDAYLYVESEDDNDPADTLQHRLRLRTSEGATAWSDWSPATTYELAPGTEGTLEAQALDRDGFVGVGILEVVVPEDTGPIGPAEVRETSDAEAKWDEDALGEGGAMIENRPAPVIPLEDRVTATTDFHTDCPDPACSTTPASPTGSSAAWLLAFGALLLGRRRP